MTLTKQIGQENKSYRKTTVIGELMTKYKC